MELVNICTGVITSVKPSAMLKHDLLSRAGNSIQTYIDRSRVKKLTDESRYDRRIENIKNYAFHFGAVLKRHVNDYDKDRGIVKHREIYTEGGHKIDYFSSEVNESEQMKWLQENNLSEIVYDRKSDCFTWYNDGRKIELGLADEAAIAQMLGREKLPKKYILIDNHQLAEVEPGREFTGYSPRKIADFRRNLEALSVCTKDLDVYREKQENNKTKIHITHRNHCGLRYCPCCQMFKRREEGYSLSETLNKIHTNLDEQKDSRSLVMITLTMSNLEIDPSGRNHQPQLIKKAKEKLHQGVIRLLRGKRNKKGVYQNPAIGFPVPDYEAHFECTFSTQTEWSAERGEITKYYVHPHLHVIALFPADYSEYNPNCYVPIMRHLDKTEKIFTRRWDNKSRKYIQKDITNTCVRYHPHKSLSEIWDECTGLEGSIVHIQPITYIGNYEHYTKNQLTCKHLARAVGLLIEDPKYINPIWQEWYWVKTKQSTLSYDAKMQLIHQKIAEYNDSLKNPDDMDYISDLVEQEYDQILINEDAAQIVLKDEDGEVYDVEHMTIASLDKIKQKKEITKAVAEVVKYINKPDTIVKKKKTPVRVRSAKNNPNIQIRDSLDFDLEICKKDLQNKNIAAVEYYIYIFDCLAGIPTRNALGLFKKYLRDVKIDKEVYKGKQKMKFTDKKTEVTSELEKAFYTAKETIDEEFVFVETDEKRATVLYKEDRPPVYSRLEGFKPEPDVTGDLDSFLFDI